MHMECSPPLPLLKRKNIFFGGGGISIFFHDKCFGQKISWGRETPKQMGGGGEILGSLGRPTRGVGKRWPVTGQNSGTVRIKSYRP